MELNEASKILENVKKKDGGLYSRSVRYFPYLSWGIDQDRVTLDGEYTAQELEAIACWMKHKKLKGD